MVGTKEMKNRVLMQCDTDSRPGIPISVKTDGLKKGAIGQMTKGVVTQGCKLSQNFRSIQKERVVTSLKLSIFDMGTGN